MFRSKKKKDIEVIKEQWKKVEDAWKSIEEHINNFIVNMEKEGEK